MSIRKTRAGENKIHAEIIKSIPNDEGKKV